MPFVKRKYNSKFPGRLKRRPLRCDKCGREIRDGEDYYARYTHRRLTSGVVVAYYCEDCYNSLYIDLDEKLRAEDRGESVEMYAHRAEGEVVKVEG